MSALETHSALRPQVYRPLTLLALNPQTPNTSALSKNERLFLSTAVPSLVLHKTANLEICGRILAKIYLVTFSNLHIIKGWGSARIQPRPVCIFLRFSFLFSSTLHTFTV